MSLLSAGQVALTGQARSGSSAPRLSSSWEQQVGQAGSSRGEGKGSREQTQEHKNISSVCCIMSANILWAKPSYTAKPKARARSPVAKHGTDGAGRGVSLTERQGDGAYLSGISSSTTCSKAPSSLVCLPFFLPCVCVCVVNLISMGN